MLPDLGRYLEQGVHKAQEIWDHPLSAKIRKYGIRLAGTGLILAPTAMASDVEGRSAQFTGTPWTPGCVLHVKNRPDIVINNEIVKMVIVHFSEETEPTRTNNENQIRGAFPGAISANVDPFENYYFGDHANGVALPTSYDYNDIHTSDYYDSFSKEFDLIDRIRASIPSQDLAYLNGNFPELAIVPNTDTPMLQVGANYGTYGVVFWPNVVITQTGNEGNYRIMRHELGHAKGLPHNDGDLSSPYHDTNSFMNGTNELFTMTEPVVTENDKNQICGTTGPANRITLGLMPRNSSASGPAGGPATTYSLPQGPAIPQSYNASEVTKASFPTPTALSRSR